MVHTMPFGKYKSVPVAAVPSDYLQWLAKVCKLSSGLRQAIAAELQARGATVPEPPAAKPPLPCPHCGESKLAHHWLQTRNNRRQISRTCSRCKASLGFAPQVEPYIAEADSRVKGTELLDVLIEAEALGIRIESDGLSCWVASEDWKRVPAELLTELLTAMRLHKRTLASLIGKTKARA